MANGRGGTWGPGQAATNVGPGGYEYPQHVNEPMGPTYDMVMSQKNGESAQDRQDSHWLGQLLPPAHSRSEERAHAFWSGTTVMDQ